ncbi:hypothetical protein DFJ74DRAFT_500079 [Hyaloraphidium curvatum]|nr:hypothetical protein DFJ74DRAFT_500079 [Hyaloraphidium curvatum]
MARLVTCCVSRSDFRPQCVWHSADDGGDEQWDQIVNCCSCTELTVFGHTSNIVRQLRLGFPPSVSKFTIVLFPDLQRPDQFADAERVILGACRRAAKGGDLVLRTPFDYNWELESELPRPAHERVAPHTREAKPCPPGTNDLGCGAQGLGSFGSPLSRGGHHVGGAGRTEEAGVDRGAAGSGTETSCKGQSRSTGTVRLCGGLGCYRGASSLCATVERSSAVMLLV